MIARRTSVSAVDKAFPSAIIQRRQFSHRTNVMKRNAALFGLLLLLSSAAPAYADQRFYATLTGAQQVPPVSTAGTGIGTVLLNTAETQITVNMSFTGLTSNANAAHIHGPAAVGSNAAVLFPFTSVPAATSGSIPQQTFAITAGQVTDLKAGNFYFNIHSDNFPGGEIRGQILYAPAQKFVGRLTGAEQVPPVSSPGTGAGTVLLNATEDQITVNLSFTGLTSNANAGHIHGPAAVGANAPVLFPFTGVPAATFGSIPEQTFAITPSQVADLKAGLYYFNIHTDSNPGGEIRGQILLAPTQKFATTLVGWQQVPPDASTATGTGTVVLSAAEDTITVNMSFSGLTSSANAAHIHGPAAAGANAPVLFPFSGVPAATAGSIPEQLFAITPTQVTQLKAGQFYFNVHSDNFPGGEIRGQILLAPVQKFVATMTGTQQVPPVSSPGTGSGTVLLNGTEDQITVNGSFSSLAGNVTAAHIHGPAPAGANAAVLFLFSGVPAATSGIIPDQSFSITAAQVAQLKSGQFYFNIHTIPNPNGEIRGQIGAVPVLTVVKAGTATSNSTVTSSPAGITCGANCTQAYDSGTMVTLTAGTPASGSFFAGWSGGGCSGAASCVVTVTADVTVTATFSPTAFTFTDDPLSAGQTLVKAVHILELRQAINTLRASNGLAAFTFTDPTLALGTTTITAVHLRELRMALDAVYTKRVRALPTYTDSTITVGSTMVKAAHIAELRLAVRLIE
jgi:Cu/Zn superoxide dismutase